MPGPEDVLSARMVPPPCYPFELSPLNELYREKLVSSIIVTIPYLLSTDTLTVSVLSHQI